MNSLYFPPTYFDWAATPFQTLSRPLWASHDTVSGLGLPNPNSLDTPVALLVPEKLRQSGSGGRTSVCLRVARAEGRERARGSNVSGWGASLYLGRAPTSCPI